MAKCHVSNLTQTDTELPTHGRTVPGVKRSKPKPLSLEAERELAEAYARGDKAAGDRLVEANIPWAYKLAHKFKRSGLPFEDLSQEALLGLTIALRRFDSSRGIRFVFYASYWIRQRLMLYCREQRGDGIHYPNASRIDLALLEERRSHPNASAEEQYQSVARRLSCASVDYIRSVDCRRSAQISTDEQLIPDESLRIGDTLSSDDDNPEDFVLGAEGDELAADDVVRSLQSPREQLIAERRIMSDSPDLLTDLADRLHLSGERVRRMEIGIKERIRARVVARRLGRSVIGQR